MFLLNLFVIFLKLELFGFNVVDGLWTGIYFQVWIPWVEHLFSAVITEKDNGNRFTVKIGFHENSGHVMVIRLTYRILAFTFLLKVGGEPRPKRINSLLFDVGSTATYFWGTSQQKKDQKQSLEKP